MMMFIRKLLLVAAASAVMATAAGAVTYTYVGSWIVGDGPLWTTNPAVYSGQGAAALLFGGSASDYAISTIDANPANINFLTFLDGWGDTQYLSNPQSQSFSLTTGTGYNDPVGGPSYSAYVLDHSCFNRYANAAEVCQGSGTEYVNYAFRTAVPEPASWALMVVGFGIVGTAVRRRTAMVAA